MTELKLLPLPRPVFFYARHTARVTCLAILLKQDVSRRLTLHDCIELRDKRITAATDVLVLRLPLTPENDCVMFNVKPKNDEYTACKGLSYKGNYLKTEKSKKIYKQKRRRDVLSQKYEIHKE